MNELKKIAKDLKAYTDYGHFCYNEISLYYVLAYRIARFAFLLKPKILGMLLKLLSYPPYYLLSIITGIQIPLTVEVGEGLRIRHFGCIIINPSSVIGKNVTILHGVTLGIRRPNEGAPTIKDNVYVGAGAKLLGGGNCWQQCYHWSQCSCFEECS